MMKRFRQTLVIGLLALAGSPIFAQPKWTYNEFPPVKGQYEYRLAHGKDKEAAWQSLQLDLCRECGVDLQSATKGHQIQDQSENGTNANYQITAFELACKCESKWWCKIVDEYKTGNDYYALYEVSTKGDFTPYFPPKEKSVIEEMTGKYGFSPRVFVPGMAQIYKGSTGKGVFFIAGEVVLVGGIVVTQSLKASYESKINTTHNAKEKLDYNTKSDNMGNISNVLIAGAAALYVWNIIDGIVAKGKIHASFGDNNLHITPFAAPDLSGGAVGGLALSFNF